MTKKEFIFLSLEKKYEETQKNGVFIANRVHHSYQVSLYSVFGFYVEIWKKLSYNQVYWVEPVNNNDTLLSYYDNIELPH
jgi:hypothetical protein